MQPQEGVAIFFCLPAFSILLAEPNGRFSNRVSSSTLFKAVLDGLENSKRADQFLNNQNKTAR
jgi:hypothetical protein